ncbi:Lycopene beta-cyclase [Massariosphaeria phaeospora]|uniref:Bifunctional lycopene cyclase/phytoene synthase n=1 Tax=Massariosphaeria phaeospora TaxID=100035 RepID=A0A7C8MU70_9PLEO|nr:Lycopene beta-cyclase [Massariosphaeria phaeospora]
MGLDYALVHVKYTIPPAILLTLFYRPLFTKLDAYKIGFLITVAVTATIPWDSYLIRTGIWSYPSHVVVGWTLFDIPLEEVFFFVVQTYNTSLLYLILSKPTFQPIYLRAEQAEPGASDKSNFQWRLYNYLGHMACLLLIVCGWVAVMRNGEGTYTGLILVWAVPVLWFLWTIAYEFLVGLPLSNTLLPIILPTLYLWIVDTLALKRGTWVISAGTKYGVHLWDGLEVEEALFFLVTNTLIVFGQVAVDNGLSIIYTFPDLFPNPPVVPSARMLMRAHLTPASSYDQDRLIGLREAVARLRKKSRSFYLASATFQGQIRSDLLLLYSFCRVADDLVDNASSTEEARQWIAKLHTFLETAYSARGKDPSAVKHIRDNFPQETHSALIQLPVAKLSRKPLQDLLRGFEMDLDFNTASPIHSEADLEIYAERVAGTVAQMCIELIFNIYTSTLSAEGQNRVIDAGNRMGVALQYVNIARDISVDAKIGRVYLPTTWIAGFGLTPESILKDPQGPNVERLRSKLLDKAFAVYEGSRAAIEELPVEACGPIRVAVESYMEIGRVLKQAGYTVKAGRATVPKRRRLQVAWRALNRR